MAAFQRAAAIAPKSQDVRTYLALHYARTAEWRARDAAARAGGDGEPGAADRGRGARGAARARRGRRRWTRGRRPRRSPAFERARALHAARRSRTISSSGVLYLASRRFADARTALDRALAARPDDPMALFKRAQVSVLLKEPDAAARIALARQKADATTQAADRTRATVSVAACQAAPSSRLQPGLGS